MASKAKQDVHIVASGALAYADYRETATTFGLERADEGQSADLGLILFLLLLCAAIGGVWYLWVQRPFASQAVLPEVMGGRVLANEGWQNTRVYVNADQTFYVEFAGGEVLDYTTVITEANGSNYVCGHARCCQPLVNAPKSALIGQIGEQIFFIGNGGKFSAPSAGELWLRVNECDAGLHDNSGFFQVRIERE